MFRNFNNASDRDLLVTRLKNVHPESPALWGKMNAGQMVCHITDVIDMVIKAQEVFVSGKAFMQTAPYKFLLLNIIPWPKGRIPAPKEVDQLNGNGTPPAEFKADINRFLQLIPTYAALTEEHNWQAHPVFGPLNRHEWGRLIYKHTDHHLKQFGV